MKWGVGYRAEKKSEGKSNRRGVELSGQGARNREQVVRKQRVMEKDGVMKWRVFSPDR